MYVTLDAHAVEIFRTTLVLAAYYNIVKYEHWALGKTSAATTHDELRRSAWIFIVCCLLRLALAMKQIYKRCRVAKVYSKATTLVDYTKLDIHVSYSYLYSCFRVKPEIVWNESNCIHIYTQVNKAKVAMLLIVERMFLLLLRAVEWVYDPCILYSVLCYARFYVNLYALC